MKTCPKCGYDKLADTARFCHKCGCDCAAVQVKRTPAAEEPEAAPLVGDKNLINESTIIGKQEKYEASNITIHNNITEDHSHTTIVCAVSGKRIYLDHSVVCPKCGKQVALEYYVEASKRCENCEQQAREEYRAFVVRTTGAGPLDAACKQQLDAEAQRLRIDAATQASILRARQQKPAGKSAELTSVQRAELEAAVSRLITATEPEPAQKSLEALTVLHENSSNYEAGYWYFLARAVVCPEESVKAYEEELTDDYWQRFWGFLSYCNTGSPKGGAAVDRLRSVFGQREDDIRLAEAVYYLARGFDAFETSMLERAGDDAARPEWLEPEFGVRDGKYYLTEQQAQAILDLRLQKLTGLEHEKLLDEYKELLEQIAELLHILGSADRLMEVIREELELIRDQFGDERRTEITANSADINIEDLINQEDVVVTLSHQGYVKYQPLTDYEAQRRGGKGKSAARIKEEDFIDRLLVANTHDTILCFSSRGRLYWMKVYQLPEASRGARGRPIVNLLPLEADERITAILPVREYEEGVNVFMATASGTVKKTALTEFSRPRSAGIIAVNLNEGDELIGVDLTSGQDEVMLFSAAGKVVRFKEDAVRAMGRTATGVRGIKLAENDSVVSLIIPRGEGAILTVTQNGYGKRTAAAEYPTKSRATQGVISIKVTERNGSVVGAVQVDDCDQIMMITDAGTLVRTRVSEVSIVGRNTQGVILIRTAEDENVVGLQRVAEPVDDEELDAIDGSAAEGDDDIAPEADTDDDVADDADE